MYNPKRNYSSPCLKLPPFSCPASSLLHEMDLRHDREEYYYQNNIITKKERQENYIGSIFGKMIRISKPHHREQVKEW